ncbi:MAG: class I SAM-dependent methyltransferase [Bdellovibrionales bacterium]|nr:class I SAM-dependent methyltransferase [Bdellovibrionales bacterium]
MAQKNKTNFSPYKRKNQGKVQSKSRGHLKADSIYDEEEANDRLFDIFKNHDFSHISHEARLAMAKYYVLLMNEQNKQNITRMLNFRDIAIKQFIDCAIINDLVKLEFPLMDVGTGPGLPGIILKILNPDKPMYLAEGVQKRVNFLKDVRESMGIQNLGIFGRNIDLRFLYPMHAVITRAVEDISNTLENVKHSLQLGGVVYFMKGPNVDEELQMALEKHGEHYNLESNIKYSLPKSTHDRRLLVFRKIKSHPTVDLEKILDLDYENDDE